MVLNEGLKERLQERSLAMEIPLMGVANVERWIDPPFMPWVPKEFFPQSIFPEARSVIVIGLPVDLPIIETSPSIWYRELYRTVNALLDQYTYRLAGFLNREGYPSVFVPRDGYGSIRVLLENPVAFFSHRHAAYLAGLGTFGVSNMLLTPGYGPRVRFGSVFTAAEIPPDPIMQEALCTRCMRCVEMCPSRALPGVEYPEGLTAKDACAAWSAKLNEQEISPCGICIRVCPVGEDRVKFGREDPLIYKKDGKYEALHRAWDHVRKYGGRRSR